MQNTDNKEASCISYKKQGFTKHTRVVVMATLENIFLLFFGNENEIKKKHN